MIQVDIKKNYYWKCWWSLSNGPTQHIKPHWTRWHYSLITYLISDGKSNTVDIEQETIYFHGICEVDNLRCKINKIQFTNMHYFLDKQTLEIFKTENYTKVFPILILLRRMNFFDKILNKREFPKIINLKSKSCY